jgi:tryptophan 2,3-dioxygenase
MKIYKNAADDVALKLTEPMREEKKAREAELADLLKSAVLGAMPSKLREANSAWPNALQKESSYAATIKKDGSTSRVYVYLKQCPAPSTFGKTMEQVIAESGKAEQVQELAEKVVDLDTRASQLRKKMACTIEAIGTSAKLRMEFPEAYEVLVQQVGDKAKSASEKAKEKQCDTVENIRAELQSAKK